MKKRIFVFMLNNIFTWTQQIEKNVYGHDVDFLIILH